MCPALVTESLCRSGVCGDQTSEGASASSRPGAGGQALAGLNGYMRGGLRRRWPASSDGAQETCLRDIFGNGQKREVHATCQESRHED